MMVLIEIIVILLLSVLFNFHVIRLWLLFYFLLFIFFLISEFMSYAPLRAIGDNFYSLDVRLSYCKYNL